MRGEGELPTHVLILQDNQPWIVENEQRIKSEQILLQQQQQFQELSNLLGRSKAMKDERRNESETESDDTLDGKRRRHRHRRSKRRKDRRQQHRRTDEGLSRESDSVSRSRS